MQISKYLFCGISLELQSEEQIQPEAEFSKFLSDYEKADYTIRVIRTDKLPEKNGEVILSSDRKKIYNDGNLKTYTAYFNSKLRRYVDFACKVNNSELYISYPDVFRELTIFEGIDLPATLLEHNIGIIHCSVIEDDGKAILFVGDKQVGKSTQAALWKKYNNAETINGDRAAVYCENNTFYADGIPFCGTSKICVNKKLPIKALVCLSKGSCNEITRLSSVEAFMKIVGKFTYNNTKENVDKISSLAGEMAEKLPVYAYSCLKDESAVTFLKDALG